MAPATSSTSADPRALHPAAGPVDTIPNGTTGAVTLIPAYEPDHRLVELVEALTAAGTGPVVVVDDGSGEGYRLIFDAARNAGSEVVAHARNRGKGAALKTGFAHIASRHPGADVVCADCDGQHTPPDIAKVADVLARGGDAVVLGSRAFTGNVPLRSRFGNAVTRFAFFAATRRRVQDTQTGLRGYRAGRLEWLGSIAGDGFDYELNVLLAASRAGLALSEVPIATVYLDGNASSHFRTVRDSVRVYVPLLRFSLSSLAAFGVDFALVLALMRLTDDLAVSVVGARLASAGINFAANKNLVFRSDRPTRSAAVRYATLALVVLALNYSLLDLLTSLGLGLAAAKLLTEVVLFALGYQVQKRFVFGGTTEAAPA